jgi:chaperonin GroEL
VCEKELSSVSDMVTILDKCVGAGQHELLLVGSVKTGALEQAVRCRLDPDPDMRIITTIVDTPVYAAMKTLFLDDLALYTGAKVLSAGANAHEFSLDMIGEAKVVVNEFSTTLLSGDGDKKLIAARAAELSNELRTASNPIEQTVVRERLGRLTGKIAILRVGGSTPIEQQEKKFKVEDAVAALQAGIKEGVVPGGGVTLARMPESVGFKHAFEQPLLALLSNAGRNADRGLWHVQQAKEWQGYDLRSDDDKLVNLEKTGVVDPTLVIKEVILNGASAAANLIKTTVLLPFDNRESKRG